MKKPMTIHRLSQVWTVKKWASARHELRATMLLSGSWVTALWSHAIHLGHRAPPPQPPPPWRCLAPWWILMDITVQLSDLTGLERQVSGIHQKCFKSTKTNAIRICLHQHPRSRWNAWRATVQLWNKILEMQNSRHEKSYLPRVKRWRNCTSDSSPHF